VGMYVGSPPGISFRGRRGAEIVHARKLHAAGIARTA
jgi:hypothetical protein